MPAWARTLVLTLAPVVVSGIAMKIFRVVQQGLTWWQQALCIAPDLLFFAGLGCALAALLWFTYPTRARTAGVVVAQVVAFLVFAIDVLAFGYFRATGLVLDYAMFAFSLGRFRETAPVIASEITTGIAVFLIVVPLWIAIAPWWRRPNPTPLRQPAASRRYWLAAIAGVLVLLSGAATIPIEDVSQSLVRDPVVHLVTGYVQSQQPEVASNVRLPPPRRTGPKKLAETPATNKQNVVVIVLESTRADATTVYSPKRRTTPFLADFAKDATHVERAYAIVPHTSKALVAILCGIEPRPSLEIVEAADKGMPANCLAKLLAGVGYDTAFFQAPRGTFEHRTQLTKNMGYARFLSGDKMTNTGFAKVNYFGFEDAIMLPPSEQWLKTQAREPFFATYLTSASHHPYGVPPSHVQQNFSEESDNSYLNAVNYVDSVVAKIVQQYKDAGLYERTIFVVVGDHGEAFGEHRLTTHDDVVYEEGLHIPLIVRAPGRDDLPKEISGPLNQLGIAPTIISLLGLRTVGGSYEGVSVFEDRGTRPLYAACYRNAQCLATIRGEMKLLYFFGDKDTLLFDLSTDPLEKHNLADQHPALVQEWTRDVMRWTLAVEEAHKDNSFATLARYVSRTRPAKIRKPLRARFGEVLEVLSCSSKRRQRGFIKVSCQLRVLSEMNDRMRLRVHGTTSDAAEIFDHKPVRGLYPMRDWQPGDYIKDTFDVRAPGAWERQEVKLCLELHDENGRPIAVLPPPATSPTCLPFATVPARLPAETPPPGVQP